MCRTAVLILLAMLLGGCYSYRPVDVTVLDGSTDKPLSGIQVCPSMWLSHLEFFPPKGQRSATTDSSGSARVQVCVNYKVAGTVRQPQIDINDDWYLIDAPSSNPMRLPIDEIKASDQQPFHVTIRLLTREEYKRKYPEESKFMP